jgi:hypothetical protein
MQPLVSHGVVPRLLDLLSSPSDAIKEAAGGAFWNIAWGMLVDETCCEIDSTNRIG